MKSDQKTISVKMENAWRSILSEIKTLKERKPSGNDWYTLEEISKKLNVSIPSLKRSNKGLKKHGFIEIFTGTVLRNGRLGNQTWYRIKNRSN